MTGLISIFLSMLFVFGEFSVSVFPKKKLEIIKNENFCQFFVDGESDDGLFKYGVINDVNLFEPGEKIYVVFENKSPLLYGKKSEVSVSCENADFGKKGYFVFSSDPSQYLFSFSSYLNGIFTIKLKTTDNIEYSFNVGIMPKNSIASDNFYYGIQPYITRAKTWNETYRIPGLEADESVEKILDTAEYLGVNLIREDGIPWSGIQNVPCGEMSWEIQDYLIEKTSQRNMKFNWIIGNGTTSWSLRESYKSIQNIQNIWTYPPDEDMWKDYIIKLASHYAHNENILWEIWNEPDWEFWSGTPEEYFDILETTAGIIKKENPSAYVYSGGLAIAYKDVVIPYFTAISSLISRGLLDNWAYHNHNGKSDYSKTVNKSLENAKNAGITAGGINSESGVGGADASLIAEKALYTRSTGSDGYVSFSFRKTIDDPGDVSNFAFFNEYLQPENAAVTFGTVIRFLGDSEFIANRSETENVIIDEYKTKDGTVYACYAFGKTAKINVPDGTYAIYDMYGNPVKTGSKVKISENPIYILTK